MRKSILSAMCLVLVFGATSAIAETPLGFTFDYLAQADASAGYKVWNEHGGTDTEWTHDYDGPTDSRAYASASTGQAASAASVEGGTDVDGMWLSSMSGAGDGDFVGANASAELEGTFSIAGSGGVTFIAEAVVDEDYDNNWTWVLEVFDPANPDQTVFSMGPGDLTVEMTLTAGKTYNIDYLTWASGGIGGGEVDVRFSAVPEPATMSLLAVGGIALLRRKK